MNSMICVCVWVCVTTWCCGWRSFVFMSLEVFLLAMAATFWCFHETRDAGETWEDTQENNMISGESQVHRCSQMFPAQYALESCDRPGHRDNSHGKWPKIRSTSPLRPSWKFFVWDKGDHMWWLHVCSSRNCPNPDGYRSHIVIVSLFVYIYIYYKKSIHLYIYIYMYVCIYRCM